MKAKKIKKMQSVEMPMENMEPCAAPVKEASAKMKMGPITSGKMQMPDADDDMVSEEEAPSILKKKPKSLKDLAKIKNAMAIKGRI